MKRDTTCNVSIATEHPQLTEEANLKASYTPGRAGGTFGLPLGAKVIVPEGLCTKKESITCTVAPPSQRWRHSASFPGEHVTSEIFTLSGSMNFKQRTVILILPYTPPEHKFLELNVKGMWKDETTWTDVGFIPQNDTPQPCVELEIDRLGTFAVTFRHKTDHFQMTPNGGLFHSRLNRNLTIRFPKKAVDTSINFTMQILPVPEDRVAFAREFFSQDCGDMQVVTEFIDLGPDAQCSFRRPATIKLPLPAGVEVEGETSNEIVVLHKAPGAGWEWVDSKCKFSRHSVTVDVKNPSKFCVVKAKADRHKKMQDAVTTLEQRLNREEGQVNVFLSLKPKSWMAVLEVFPKSDLDAKLDTRLGQGFEAVEKVEEPKAGARMESYSRRPPHVSSSAYRPKTMEGFELFDTLSWNVQLTQDLQLAPDSESDRQSGMQLQCYRHLPESYCRVMIEPGYEGEEMRDLRGVMTLTPAGIDDPKLREVLTLTFHLDVPEGAVTEYYYVPEPEPEPEPSKPKLKFDLPSLLAPTPVKVAPKPVEKPRTFSTSAMERLTQPSRKINIPEKEAKVLTGRSLMALSKVVSEGLTLAVHLDLPESTITGIGFDALSNGRSMADVSYKILLYWKRTRKDKRDGAVQHLLAGLRSMGKQGVADIVLEKHRDNRELSMDSFLSAAVAGINLSTVAAS